MRRPFRLISRFLSAGIGLVFAAFLSSSISAQEEAASREAGIDPNTFESLLWNQADVSLDSRFQAFAGYRWLHADRMFIHDHEQKQFEEEGSEEINDSHFMDIGLRYSFSPRVSSTLTLPFSFHDRSQVYRALDFQRTILGRFHTRSAGWGDVRLEGNAWLLDPKKQRTGNVLFGLGFSAPSGDADVQDEFKIVPFRGPVVSEEHAVDQSIQSGNGGWGILFDLYAFRELMPRLKVFLNGAYSLTPEEKYSPTRSLYGDYSIGDSYLSRGGFEYLLWPKYALSLSLGGRIDGVPVHDLVGGSDGFRRPGYAVSIEPGISVAVNSWGFALNTPVALYRNRQQSVSERDTGMETVASAFTDVLVTFSISKSF